MKRVLITTLGFIVTLAALAAESSIHLSHLTVEGRIAPIGIDVKNPRMGWQIETNQKGVKQQSYRILVSSSLEKLSQNEGDAWDSREVKSDASQWVCYQGKPLLPNAVYYYKVQVKTNKGTSWSEPTSWTTGLLEDNQWKGCWIGSDSLMPWDRVERHSRLSSRYLRKEFSLKKQVRRATLHISGLGRYVAYLNGKRIGKDLLTPNGTDYTKSVIYNTYDVTDLLHEDKNAIGVVLSGGHYFAPVQQFEAKVRTTYGMPKLLSNLIVEYADGTSETIVSDTTWHLHADGAVRYAHEYDGELYDATKEWKDWTCVDFDDSAWQRAEQVQAPGGKMCGNVSPAMSVYQTERPVSIHRFADRFIVDFGTNNAGRIRMNMNSAKGDTIRLRHAELLEEGDSTLYVANLRSALQTTTYVSDGQPRQWAPEFTFYGFRYVEVKGVCQLSEDDILRELIADRMEDSHTSLSLEDKDGNDMLCRIIDNARRGIRSNYKGMPIDCPQRDERMPWLGDRTTGCRGESYMMNNYSLYAKWAKDIVECQRPDGKISDVAPSYWRLYNKNVTWPAALPFVCDMLYRQYGDLQPMRDSYAAIAQYLKMIRQDNYKDGLVVYDRYGDWCVPPESPNLVHSKDPARKTDGKLISSTYYYYLCQMMQRYAALWDKKQDVAYYQQEMEQTLKAVNDSFFVAGRYANGTVTANLLPLAMKMVNEKNVPSVLDSLIQTITVKYDSHLSCGVIGIQWLMCYLSQSGHGDLAYRLATNDTYPSWGYMVKNGATTIWELWNGNTANPSMNSGNHVMLLGDLLAWCYEYLGGIRPATPGFKEIVLNPDFSVRQLNGVKAEHPSPYGLIRSEWKRVGKGKITWKVEIPANTSATLILPNGRQIKKNSGTYIIKTNE